MATRELVADELTTSVRTVAGLARRQVDCVASSILPASVEAAYLATLWTAVSCHHSLDAVGWELWARHELAADLAAAWRAGALSAAKVHKVGLASRHTAAHKASLQAVIVLVALAGTALLHARGTTGARLQRLLYAVLQWQALDARAVLLWGCCTCSCSQHQGQGQPSSCRLPEQHHGPTATTGVTTSQKVPSSSRPWRNRKGHLSSLHGACACRHVHFPRSRHKQQHMHMAGHNLSHLHSHMCTPVM